MFDKNCTENGLRGENRWRGIYCFASKYHQKNAVDVAEKLRNSIVLLKFDGKRCQGLSVSASFAVSAITRKGISFEDLLAQADKALYVSRKEGKKQSVFMLRVENTQQEESG